MTILQFLWNDMCYLSWLSELDRFSSTLNPTTTIASVADDIQHEQLCGDQHAARVPKMKMMEHHFWEKSDFVLAINSWVAQHIQTHVTTPVHRLRFSHPSSSRQDRQVIPQYFERKDSVMFIASSNAHNEKMAEFLAT